MEATFRAPAPYRWITIISPQYVDTYSKGIELAENRRERVIVGTIEFRYCFSEGKGFNEITLTEGDDILRMRVFIADHSEYTELSCDEDAGMLGGGENPVEKPTGIDKHTQHREELMRKYGEKDDKDLDEWDRKYIGMLKR
jgi:hypothetical protein